MKGETRIKVGPNGELVVTKDPNRRFPQIFPFGHRDAPPDLNAIIARTRGNQPPRGKRSCVLNDKQ